MTFIVTLIALLIERFFDWSHLRNWNWYTNYQQAVTKRFSGTSPFILLAITIVPLLIVVAILEFVLRAPLFGLVELLFQLLLFLYCLGPQNLWADSYACINALVHGDTQAAAEKLKTSFGVTDSNSKQALHGQLLNNIFIAANRRVFAIVFWFMVLGPIGAVLYRVVTLSSAEFSKQAAVPELIPSARSIESILDWIPVRIFACVFALGGHFVKVISCWRKKPVMGLEINDKLLMDCGAAALGNDNIASIAEDGSAEKSAIGLLDRSFVITLVLIAVMVILI
jgi:AmpE protein